MVFDFAELRWHGHVWPAARVTGPVQVISKDERGNRMLHISALHYVAQGKGRPLVEMRPCGYWRDFAAMDFSDPVAVAGFVNRKGDPTGLLSATTPSDTSDWPEVAEALLQTAKLWEPIAIDGVSRCGASDFAIGQALDRVLANRFMRRECLEMKLDAVDKRGKLSLLPTASTLATYMLASAAFGLHQRADMRLCQRCSDHFIPARSDARFCGAACRTAASVWRNQITKGA